MKATLSRKQRFFNQINLTKDDDLYIGIDVHKANYHVALYLNDAHAIDFITPADNAKLSANILPVQRTGYRPTSSVLSTNLRV